MEIFIIIVNTIIYTGICLGLLFAICVFTWHAPMDTTQPAENRLSKKELDFIFVQIIENEKEFRALRWRYITAGSNARYL